MIVALGLAACGDESPSGVARERDGGGATADASMDGRPGTGGVATGGTGAASGAAGTAGAAAAAAGSGAQGGGGFGGAAIDAAPDAALVCNTSGPVDCSPSSAPTYECADPPPILRGRVTQAIQGVLALHPEWFDFDAGFPCCPLATQPQSFLDAVVAAIAADGACAQRDPNNPNIELVVKRNNQCSEQYAILTSGSVVRNPPKHQGSCVPAWL